MSKSKELHINIVEFVMNKFMYDSTENLYNNYLLLEELVEKTPHEKITNHFLTNNDHINDSIEDFKRKVDEEVFSLKMFLNLFAPPVLKNIDYKMLSIQKEVLVNESTKQNGKFDGIINLIDNIQDNAVNLMGLPESEVFPNLENE